MGEIRAVEVPRPRCLRLARQPQPAPPLLLTHDLLLRLGLIVPTTALSSCLRNYVFLFHFLFRLCGNPWPDGSCIVGFSSFSSMAFGWSMVARWSCVFVLCSAFPAGRSHVLVCIETRNELLALVPLLPIFHPFLVADALSWFWFWFVSGEVWVRVFQH